MNWPNGAYEPVLGVGDFALGGTRQDGSWWYELAPGGPYPRPDCVLVYGGSFDLGDAVQLSTGVVLSKAKGFAVRDAAPGPSTWFPATRTTRSAST